MHACMHAWRWRWELQERDGIRESGMCGYRQVAGRTWVRIGLGRGHMQGVDGKWGRLRGMQDVLNTPHSTLRMVKSREKGRIWGVVSSAIALYQEGEL